MSAKQLFDSLGALSVAMAMSHLKDNIPKLKTEIEKEYQEKKKEITKREEEKSINSLDKSFDSSKIESFSSKISKNITERKKTTNTNGKSFSINEHNKTIFPIKDDEIEIIYSTENSNLNFQKKKLDFYEKNLMKKQYIENQLNKKRKKKEKIEQNLYTNKPEVNEISKKIVRNKFHNNYIPINQRGIQLGALKQTQYLINEQKKDLDALNLQKGKIKLNDYQINNFIKKQFEWKEQIDDKKLGLQIIKKIKSEDNLFNETNDNTNTNNNYYTNSNSNIIKSTIFLSKKTEELANKKINKFCEKYHIKRSHIYDRLYQEGITKEKEIKKLSEKYKNTFQPYINKYKKYNSYKKEDKILKKNHSDIHFIEKKMIDVNKTSKKHYSKANSIILKRSSKIISKNVSINNENDKKEEDDSKISNIQNKNNPFMRNSIRASLSINKMNYDTNHSTNNNILSLDIKNIDSISKKEHNLTPKLRDINTSTIQNINKPKENNDNYESNYQNINQKTNIKNLISMDFNFNFDEDQKNFEQESDILTKSDIGMTSLLRKSSYKEFDEPSWIEELIQISNEKSKKNYDIQNRLYKINIGNSSATGKNKPFTVIGKNEIFANLFKKYK